MHLQLPSRIVGPDQPVLVIAEVGVNHDGSVDRAIELVGHAADAGADAVKLQVFRAASLMNRSAGFAEYQRQRCDDADPAAMLRRYELSDDELAAVVDEIRRRGLISLATPFSPSDCERLARLDLPAIKIASPDLVNYPLLYATAKSGRPLLLSTGAATMEEVERTVGWLREWKAPFALLHCISSYPVKAENAHLGWIGQLQRRFDVPVGYSDHTTELLAGAMAVAAGACIVEKHLTYDRAAQGPDHSASADPAQFAGYVYMIRNAERLRGRGGKQVLPCEQDVRTVSRQSLVVTKDLPAGHTLADQDLTTQRPGTGVSAAEYGSIIGRRLKAQAGRGSLLRADQVE